MLGNSRNRPVMLAGAAPVVQVLDGPFVINVSGLRGTCAFLLKRHSLDTV